MPWSTDLSTEWRALALQLRDLGVEDHARTLEWCSDRLEEDATSWESEALTLDEATKESGYSYSSLQQKVASEEIPNVGEIGKPRVRRMDLPRKAPSRSHKEEGEPDIAEEILAGKL